MKNVVLVHGLWAPGAVMQPLAARLALAGFRCRTFSYMGASRPLAAHAERLARFARELGPAHFLGHSLGGLVVLEALCAHPELAAGRVALLGTPARGCDAARRLARHRTGRWLLGRSAEHWGGDGAARWTRAEALGVIAGSHPFGLGRLLGPLTGVNDGVVRLEETAVEGMAGRIVLPVSHSAMLISSRVADNVAHFLAHGQFAPAR
ncbi:MAG: alpha/beta fold hydrolase [Burkholderiales bacterium]|nr:alpha/beta fold hydrolase [Burkholderiales bacterium]